MHAYPQCHRHGLKVLSRHPYVMAAISMLAVLVNRPAPGQVMIIRQAQAKRIARQKGWVVRRETPKRTIELQRIVNGIPMYYTTWNLDAADSLSTDECWPGGSGGLGLTGQGVTLGIWDGGGVHTTHIEFNGRAVQRDAPFSTISHATHVAGTMIGTGLWVYNPAVPEWADQQSKGMSPSASLDCYDWNADEVEMAAAAEAGLLVSNHSYGMSYGWMFGDFGPGPGWYWFGDVSISTYEDHWFGFYNSLSANWDRIAYDYPSYLFVVAAGNERGEGPTPGEQHWYFDPVAGDWASSTDVRSPDGPYDCISSNAVTKNGLIVGAVEDVVGGYAGPGSVRMTSFSSWGPADDGRIKPDVVGNGWELFSSTYLPYLPNDDFWYEVMSGTSMASPNVSGSLGLLIEHHRNTHPTEGDMLAATLKALVIHTADECGAGDGPDYEYGWGLVNTLRAASTISTDVTIPLTISEQTVQDGQTYGLTITTDGSSSELRATLCWTDPPGVPPPPSLDPPTKMLVNDLDLRLESDATGTIYEPWVLDPMNPSAPATTGNNNTDNVEQVVVYAPGLDTFSLRVTPKGSLSSGKQDFSLVITGAATILPDCNANGVSDLQDISDGTSADCNADDIPDECELEDNDCNADAIPDDCNIAAGTSSDCNANGVPDECDISGGGVLLDVDFESGLPPDWSVNGTFQVTDQCRAMWPTCGGNGWAYAGDLATCSYGDLETGELIAPPVTLAYGTSELRFCSRLLTEEGYDFASVRVNGTPVWQQSGGRGAWEEQSIDLGAFAGKTVVITFRFGSDELVSGTLGWEVDNVYLISRSLDCNGDGIPDGCGESVLPKITQQPVDANVFLGQSAVFTVSASGLELTYQWQKDGIDIPGATGPVYTIANTTLEDFGVYRVKVNSPCGTVISEEAKLSRFFTLSVQVEGQGSVTLEPPGGVYGNRTTVKLIPTATQGWRFSAWGGNITGNNPTMSLVMLGDTAVTATFVEDETRQFDLKVNTVGQVTVTPGGGAYEPGTEVTLQAAPGDGWVFVRWAGSASGTETTTSVVMDADRTVVAIAQPIAPAPQEAPSSTEEGETVEPGPTDVGVSPENLCGNCGPGFASATLLTLLLLVPLVRNTRKPRRRSRTD